MFFLVYCLYRSLASDEGAESFQSPVFPQCPGLSGGPHDIHRPPASKSKSNPLPNTVQSRYPLQRSMTTETTTDTPQSPNFSRAEDSEGKSEESYASSGTIASSGTVESSELMCSRDAPISTESDERRSAKAATFGDAPMQDANDNETFSGMTEADELILDRYIGSETGSLELKRSPVVSVYINDSNKDLEDIGTPRSPVQRVDSASAMHSSTNDSPRLSPNQHHVMVCVDHSPDTPSIGFEDCDVVPPMYQPQDILPRRTLFPDQGAGLKPVSDLFSFCFAS